MATFQTEDGEEERPLIFTDPDLSATMAKLRDMIVRQQGSAGDELVGMRADASGQWLGVFKRAPEA